jgi:flagellar basal-body rod protein FlgC
MEIFAPFKVSASAIDAQRKRMNVIASNLANAQTTRTQAGGPYRRKDVIFSTIDIGDGKNDFKNNFNKEVNLAKGVSVSNIIEDDRPPTMIYDPDHPDADSAGYVAMPNVNTMEEMTNMMLALRAYEANVTVFNLSKGMYAKTLEIGR